MSTIIIIIISSQFLSFTGTELDNRMHIFMRRSVDFIIAQNTPILTQTYASN